jgi:transcriptional regulator with XRE-family HTH domain
MARSDFEKRFPTRSSQVVRTLALNVRHLRTTKGWTQDDLAVKARIQQNAVSLIEHARANPTLETLETIAMCLGVRFIDLFDSKLMK